MTRRKSDAAEIREFVDELAGKRWLGPVRARWPRYLFRFDDVEAAARILTVGSVFSRAKAEADGLMVRDCANRGIIAGTPEEYKGFARLYFRPRTPTQYVMEGFRSGRGPSDANCPVPIFLAFDSVEVLTRESTRYSNGNLGKRGVLTGSDAGFLRALPFEKIYHDDAFSESERDLIVFHRNAEVMIPEELDLAGLKYIGCRSDAEYETLLSLLDKETRERWRSKMGTKGQLHERKWTFVERVDVIGETIVIRFNGSTRSPGPFKIVVSVTEGDSTATWESPEYIIEPIVKIDASSSKLAHRGPWTIRIDLDGCLAFRGTEIPTSEPV